MQGARRRPYVDMVEEGNAAADRPGRNPGGDGAIWAHLFVGSPCNIDILLRALLLDLHPTSPPSHTCLVMKQVLVNPLARSMPIRLAHLGTQPFRIPVLGEILVDTGVVYRAVQRGRIPAAGDDHAHRIRVHFPDLCQELDAADAGHVVVADDDSDVLAGERLEAGR